MSRTTGGCSAHTNICSVPEKGVSGTEYHSCTRKAYFLHRVPQNAVLKKASYGTRRFFKGAKQPTPQTVDSLCCTGHIFKGAEQPPAAPNAFWNVTDATAFQTARLSPATSGRLVILDPKNLKNHKQSRGSTKKVGFRSEASKQNKRMTSKSIKTFSSPP